MIGFLAGDLVLRGDTGEEDRSLTIDLNFSWTSGGSSSGSDAGSISGERSDDDEVIGAVGGEHIGVVVVD